MNQADARGHVAGAGVSETGNVKGTFDGSVNIPNDLTAETPIIFDDPDDFDSHDSHDPSVDPELFYGPVQTSGWQALDIGCVELDNLSYTEAGVDHMFGDPPAPFFRGLRCSPATTAHNTKLPMISATGFTPSSPTSLGVIVGGLIVPLFMARKARVVWPTPSVGDAEVNARKDVIAHDGFVIGQMNARRDAPGAAGIQEGFHVARTDSGIAVTNGGVEFVAYTSEVADLNEWWDLGTEDTNFVIPTGYDGVWFFIGNLLLQSPGGAGPRWTANIQKNTANTSNIGCPNNGVLAANNIWTASGLDCVAGDSIRLAISQNYGGAPGFLNVEGAHFYGFRCNPIEGDSVARAAKVTKLGNTSIANSTTVWTPIAPDAVEFDINGEFNGTTPTIPLPGIYLILVLCSAAANSTGNRGLRWLVDGVVQPEGWMTINAAGALLGMGIPALRAFSGGEVITVEGIQNSGGALNFAGMRLFMYLIAPAP